MKLNTTQNGVYYHHPFLTIDKFDNLTNVTYRMLQNFINKTVHAFEVEYSRSFVFSFKKKSLKMGKKDKGKKKGKGAEKTAMKTDKKLVAKQKKLLEKIGEVRFTPNAQFLLFCWFISIHFLIFRMISMTLSQIWRQMNNGEKLCLKI